jgi:hypothetical protein
VLVSLTFPAFVPFAPQRWEQANPAAMLDVFCEVLGQGDPLAAAELHWRSITAAMAGSGPATGQTGMYALAGPFDYDNRQEVPRLSVSASVCAFACAVLVGRLY